MKKAYSLLNSIFSRPITHLAWAAFLGSMLTSHSNHAATATDSVKSLPDSVQVSKPVTDPVSLALDTTAKPTMAEANAELDRADSTRSSEAVAPPRTTQTGPAFDPVPYQPEPLRPLFYDRNLNLRQYGFSMGAGFVAGALGFFIGSALEGAILDDRAKNGTLKFTGIRYDHLHGAFYGGGAGLLLGTGMTVYFVGDADEEEGGFWLTMLGTALSTAAGMGLADLMGVQDEVNWTPFIPILLVPPIGGVVAYEVSRWIQDKRRMRILGQEARLESPRLDITPGPKGLEGRLTVLSLRF